VTAPLQQTFLVECFVPGSEREAVEAAGGRMKEAIAGLREEGCEVDYLRAILVPGDEVVFHVVAAPDAAVVCEASRRAAVEFERIVESVAVDAQQVPH
jgi:hypothetical protein